MSAVSVLLRLFALLFFATITLLIVQSAPAHAQYDLIFGTDLAIELSPANPAPNERVRATVRSSVLDLSNTSLRWSASDKVLAEGVGATEVELTAGALGSETKLRVVALEGELEFATAIAFIRPVELDLLWEADSYVPPFYRGRALPSAGTSLRLEAIPRFVQDGKQIPAGDIVFTWRRDGYVIQPVSGRGKSTAVIAAPPLFGAETISVEAITLDGRLGGAVSARISSVEPRLMLYQDHPVFGIAYHRALAAEDQIPEIEVTLAAVPYFAEAKHPDDEALVYDWRINGTKVERNPERPSTLTINASGSTGQALIELALTHTFNLFLGSSGSWSVLLQSGAAAGTPFSTNQ